MRPIRSAMAVVSPTSEPVGILTEMETWPMSMEGSSTVPVDRQQTTKKATSATETSIPTFRWWTK